MIKMKRGKESDLQKSILDYLRYHKYIAVKFSSVGIYNKKTGKYIKQPQRGISDILCCSPKGQFIAIECKIKPNKPSKEQLQFLADIRKNNGIAIVAYTVGDVIEVLN